MPWKIEVAPGKSALVFSVPCQVTVQPPVCFGMLSAPSPATSTRELRRSGSRPRSFFSSTSDSRTACRASARCSGAPSSSRLFASGRDDGRPFSNRPGAELHAQDARHRIVDARQRNLLRAHLLERVADEVLPLRRHHEHVDAGVDRLRALVLRAALHFVDAVPVADDDAVEAHALLQHVREQVRSTPCTFSPFQLLYDAMTVCTPALIAAT